MFAFSERSLNNLKGVHPKLVAVVHRALELSAIDFTVLEGVRSQARQDEILPRSLPRISVEAGTTFGWAAYATDSVGIDRFGASAPGNVVMAELGITADHVADVTRNALHR